MSSLATAAAAMQHYLDSAETSLDGDGNPKIDLATCGTCGRTWNDAAQTEYTPAPSGRCPFEYFHKPERSKPSIDKTPIMLEALQNIFRAQLCPEPKTLKGWAQRNSLIDRIVRNALNSVEGSSL